ncbi:MAG: hypothetical protein U1E65_13015 [Myxococcota bacterium]
MNLDWHQNLPAAIASATREDKPILSLRLLGRLDERLSCANSRFFRAMLYPEPRIERLLKTRFVLHWRSVRPVPVVTIDFGDGRTIRRTLTGNSVHLILAPNGRPIDALPGMYAPEAFLEGLLASLSLDPGRDLGPQHRRRLQLLDARWAEAAASIGAKADAPPTEALLEALAAPRAPRPYPSARTAGAIAVTKAMVEMPLLERISPVERAIALDTLRNEQLLHRQIHQRFVAGVSENEAELSDWIYRTLFLMPPEDPWLGLEPSLPFADLVD